MRRLSVTGLVLAGIYTVFSAVLVGCAWRPDCIDQHGFVYFMPLLPLSGLLHLVGLVELHTVLSGLPVSSRLGAYSVYYGLIGAHLGALYGLSRFSSLAQRTHPSEVRLAPEPCMGSSLSRPAAGGLSSLSVISLVRPRRRLSLAPTAA